MVVEVGHTVGVSVFELLMLVTGLHANDVAGPVVVVLSLKVIDQLKMVPVKPPR